MHHTIEKIQGFNTVFKDVNMDEKLRETFCEACVSRLQYIKATNQVEITLQLPRLVEMKRVYSLEKVLGRHLNTSVHVVPCFCLPQDGPEILETCKNEFLQVIAKKSKHYECLLEDAVFRLEGCKLNILLSSTQKPFFNRKLPQGTSEFYSNQQREVSVCFIDLLSMRREGSLSQEKQTLEQKTIQRW